jgi:protein-disulfide isomerase
MEKAFLPVSELLGDEADFSIKFVHYIMHGEMEAVENARDYCVQKDFPEQFNSYMTCFIKSGKNGVDNSAVAQACLALSDVDPVAIDSCVAKARTEFKIDEDLASGEQYPRFGIDAEASNSYGVQGSPTLVINGVQVSAGRTPEAVKDAVCDAFLEAPEACNTELSSESFEPGFGLAASAATSAATCG